MNEQTYTREDMHQAWMKAYGKGYSDAIWKHGHNPKETSPYLGAPELTDDLMAMLKKL